MMKILLSACTVCAFGQGSIAQAQSSKAAGQTPSSPAKPAPDPSPATSPADASDSQPAPPDDPSTETPAATAVPDTSQPPPDSPPDSSTTTTTTTTTTSSTGGDATATPPTPPTPPPAPPPEAAGAESDTDMFAFNMHNPRLRSGIGVSAMIGGGVVQFTNSTMRDTTSNLGGLWNLHVTFGTHLPLALDLAYVGSATHISGLPNGDTRTLLGSAAEGTVRWMVLPNYAWTPYVFGGVGYQRYDVKGGNVSLSDTGMNSSDNLLSVPAGLGFVWRGNNGLVADIHGTYRFTWFQDLVLKNGAPIGASGSNSFVSLNNWEASAAIGYEF
jgi:hypothetical protein